MCNHVFDVYRENDQKKGKCKYRPEVREYPERFRILTENVKKELSPNHYTTRYEYAVQGRFVNPGSKGRG